MSYSPQDLANLSPEEKRALLVKLLQQKARGATSSVPPPQERAGFFDQFALCVTDLDAQAILDSHICPRTARVEPQTEPAHIFLTGATGFLGAFVLYELLRQTEADIHCLVRCANVQEGQNRIETNLASYGLSRDDQSSRIIPVVGDLSQPLLGLSPEQFDALAGKIEAIYHNGAEVNWIYSYTRLKPTNVLGTQEVLRLASHLNVKPLHFVSSFSVFPFVGAPKGKLIREQDSLDHGGVLYGGYTQSKWVAEKLVTLARARGLPVCVYRPGLIIGHSQTGAWNTNDVMSRMIKSWIELGGAPDMDVAMDMTPVDYVSSAIVQLSRSEGSLGNVFHLVNPQPIHMHELVSWICSFGYHLERIPYEQWRAEFINRARRSRETAISSLLPLFSAWMAEEMPRSAGSMPNFDDQNTLDRLGSIMAAQYAMSSIKFDDRNTLGGLAGTSIICPSIDAELFARYLSYFIHTGFLDAPELNGEDAV